MQIFNKYLAKQIITTTAITSLALLGIDLFFYLINELRFIGNGDYNLNTAIIFIALTIPRKIYIMFPWAAIIGSLICLGTLAKSSELDIMRTSGVSISKIIIAILKGASIMILAIFLLGEIVAPKTEKMAQNIKNIALQQNKTITTQYGTWIRNKNSFINIKSMQNEELLSNVTQHFFDNGLQLTEILHAKQAILIDKSTWKLKNVNSLKISADQVKTIYQPELIVNDFIDTKILQSSNIKHLERLSLVNLWEIITTRLDNDLNAKEYQLAFWGKIAQPFAILVMIFLATPSMFGSMRNASNGLRLLIGTLIGFSFHILNQILVPLVALSSLNPALAAIAPAAVFFIIGCYVLYLAKL